MEVDHETGNEKTASTPRGQDGKKASGASEGEEEERGQTVRFAEPDITGTRVGV